MTTLRLARTGLWALIALSSAALLRAQEQTPAAQAAAASATPAPESQPDAPAAAGSAAPAQETDADTAPAADVPAPAVLEQPGATTAADHERIAQGLLNLGTSLTERGDYPAAEIAYRQILHNTAFSRADQSSALLGLARMYRKKSAFTQAAAVYEKFLKEFPADLRTPEALLELGRTHRAMGAYKLAISRFYSVINSTLKLPPHGWEHYQLLAKTAQFEIAETHFESGDFIEAGKFFARLRLLDLAPVDRARAHFKSAYALVLANELESAVTTLRAYLDQWPSDDHVPEARYHLAITLRKLNRPEEALAVTLELLRETHARSNSDPKSWAYWQRRTGNQLANDFFKNGDTTDALAIYQSLAALSPDPAWRLPITYQVALCYERLRDADWARDTYKSIVDASDAAAKTERPFTGELAEIARMSAWRISHLSWNEQTDRQLTAFFSTATGKAEQKTPPPPPANDTDGSPSETPAAL